MTVSTVALVLSAIVMCLTTRENDCSHDETTTTRQSLNCRLLPPLVSVFTK